MGLSFNCIGCGACCCWDGDVCLEDDEIQSIASFLDLSESDFTSLYCRLRSNRQGLSLINVDEVTAPICSHLLHKDANACIMLTETSTCHINTVKPRQCRGFPLLWNFPGWQDKCGGGTRETFAT